MFIIAMLLPALCGVRAADGGGVPSKDDLLSKYSRLSPEQLIDTAKYYYAKREYDASLLCYSLVVNAPETDGGDGLKRLKIDALNASGVIYYHWMFDCVSGYRMLVEALNKCETLSAPNNEIEFRIEANIGNIYYNLDEFGIAEQYYSRALELCTDSVSIMLLHNNIGAAKMQRGDLDGALRHVGQALDIGSRRDSANLYGLLNTAAAIDVKRGRTEEAMLYFRRALEDARKNGAVEYEAGILSGMGELLLDTGRCDRAEPYVAESNRIAGRNGLSNVLLANHMLLARMKRKNGDYPAALDHMERYNKLKDSLFSSDKLANINQLRRVGEISKANRQIELMAVEQQVKERTISYQKIILAIVLAVLASLTGVLVIVFSQKKRLNRAYHALFEKNIRIVELHDMSRGMTKSPTLHHDDGLLERILSTMEETGVICNPNFSINMLSSLVEANHAYVSQTINNTMGKNFRTLLNEYRIREAQRLLSNSDAAKYTIESISLQLGYKSQNTFRAAFQEITGVSPSFYLKTMRTHIPTAK